jgi:hypothetical protein
MMMDNQRRDDQPVVKMLSTAKDLTMRPSFNAGSVIAGRTSRPA